MYSPGGCNGQSAISWRVPLGLQIVFAIIFGLAVYLAPYSPRWLMMQDRGEEAIEVLMAYVDCPKRPKTALI